mgnify:CR=1 FL=1|jgi:general secretion pathway protein E
MLKKVDPVEKILISKNQISASEIEEIKTNNFQNGNFLGKTLVEHGYIRSEVLLETLSKELGIPYVTAKDFAEEELPVPDFPVSTAFLKEKLIFPIKSEPENLTIAVFNPFDLNTIDELKVTLQKSVKTVLCSEEVILESIESFYGEGNSALGRIVGDIAEEDMSEMGMDSENADHIRDMASEAPVIKLVNHLFSQAIEKSASDIHLEPFEHDLILRYRIDGVLHDFEAPPKRLHAAISSRIKIMAQLDISERRLPQDGRIKLKTQGKDIDVRVSTLPTLYGESVVMRILDKGEDGVFSLEGLGFPEKELRIFEKIIQKPYGKFLVTGPTGSGKTTTLYGALQTINTQERKIITVEDPVEYQLKGVNQIHVKSSIGLTFAHGLRSIVRQDPDVIMIGEIRDAETAGIAIQAALTGHMVFSTVHTNDAAGAITRLVDMGVENFLISSALIGVLAQRLVRVICEHCKEKVQINPSFIKEMGDYADQGYTFLGKGCDRCSNTGYKGRKGLYELMTIDNDIRKLIVENASAHLIRDSARSKGMNTLREDGWEKVLAGVTTPEEVLRVTLNNEL